jgi:excisionase family DNA binding protein
MSNQITENVYLKPAEVAKTLRISIPQVHRILRRGDLPCLRIGPCTVRVDRADLQEYIRRVKSG